MIRSPDGPMTRFLLLFYSSLVCAGNLHIFPVFRDGSASNLDALRLQNAGNLFVGQLPAAIFPSNQLLDAALQDQQRSAPALRALHALGEKIPQFENRS